MRIVDVGSGPPLVLVPGIQGRWEWMKPAVDALARRCRVLTFSLADEPGWGTFDPAHGLDSYVDQIRAVMDAADVARAAICGVSYGGLIAALFAARHPERSAGLILVSAIPPGWKPDPRVRFYLRAPRLLSPLFCVGSLRLYPEIAAAAPGFPDGLRAALGHAFVAVTHMFSPTRMARRVLLLEQLDLRDALAGVRAPVLVVTGDEQHDRVVPVGLTHEYLRLWPHARTATLHRTGHLGLITKPAEFADLVVRFVRSAADTPEPRRRIG